MHGLNKFVQRTVFAQLYLAPGDVQSLPPCPPLRSQQPSTSLLAMSKGRNVGLVLFGVSLEGL